MDKYYKILDLHAGASEQEVKRAYRELVKVWHPDRFTHDIKLQKRAEQKIKEINTAYQRIVEHLNNSYTQQQSQKYQQSEKKEKPAGEPPHSQPHNSWICPECLRTNYMDSFYCGCGFKTNAAEIETYKASQTSAGLYENILFNKRMNYMDRAIFLARYLLMRFPNSKEADIIKQGARSSTSRESFHNESTPSDKWHKFLHKKVSRWNVIPGSIIFTLLLFGLIVFLNLVDTNSSKEKQPVQPQPSKINNQIVEPSFSEPMQPLPINGAIKRYVADEAIAPLKIVTRDSGNHYFVKIVDWYTKKKICTVFIRAGQSVSLAVPLGAYRLRYAAGEKWYGTKFLFGPRTAYSEADKQLDFGARGDQVYGYTVELYLRPSGNLRTNKITATTFEENDDR